MQKMNHYLLGSLLATQALLGTSLSWAQDATAQATTQAAVTTALTKNTVNVGVPAAFKEVKQIVIGSFKVGFINYNKAAEKSGGGFFSRDKESRVVLRSKLEGISPEPMQAIVDALYADFSAQLKAQGVDVLDRAALTALPAFASIGGAPSPYAVDGVSVVPQAQALYFAPTGHNVIEFIGEANRASGLAGLASIGSKISASNASIGLQEMAEKNKLAILNVHYILNFVNAEGNGGATQKLTRVSLNQGLTVMPGSSVSLITGYDSTFSTKNGNLTLTQAIASDEPFGEFAETTSTIEKAAGIFSMVNGALSGGNSTNSGEYTIKANPETYQKIALQLLKTGNTDFVSTLASLR